MDRLAARLECLKVAASLREVTGGLRPVQDVAKELFTWASAGEAPPADKADKAPVHARQAGPAKRP